MSFVVKCYNLGTGHVETVSEPFEDVAQSPYYSRGEMVDSFGRPVELMRAEYREVIVSGFAWADASDNHVYYAGEPVSVVATATVS